MTSRDFGAISLINGIMFMTANGSRSVLVPLHGVQAFGLTTTIMGAPRSTLPCPKAHAPLACLSCSRPVCRVQERKVLGGSGWQQQALRRRACGGPGLLFAGMAVVSLVGVMPAAWVADHLGRKWTIVPSCLGLAASLLLMAATRAPPTCPAWCRCVLRC